jgi:hypothetical protein
VWLDAAPLRADAVDEGTYFGGRTGLSEARKDARDAVGVGVEVHVGHGIDGKRDVEAEFLRLARGRLDTDAGGDTGENDLRDAEVLQVVVEAGVRERSPGALGDGVVCGLLVAG